jgi:hypothetical protein
MRMKNHRRIAALKRTLLLAINHRSSVAVAEMHPD